MEHIKIFIIDLPERIHGLTVRCFDVDGVFYTILINAKLSDQMQCDAYDHEIAHINNGDFDRMWSLDELEALRHAV